MAYQHPHTDTTNSDSADIDRKLIAERVLKRVRLAKATRSLQTRLSLASFKASRGWHNVTFDVIEPHMMQAAEQRRRSNTAPVLRNGSPDVTTSRTKHRTRAARHPINPAPTATLITPDRGSSLHQPDRAISQYPTHPPVLRPASVLPPTFSEFSHAAMPSTEPVRRTFATTSAAPQQPLKRPLHDDVIQQTSNQTPLTPSASQPAEYVNAANVLNSLSRAPSTASLHSASPLAWPRSCPPEVQPSLRHIHSSSTHQRARTPERSVLLDRPAPKSLAELEEEEAKTNAAELMLFLAAGSPSPTRRIPPESSSTDQLQTTPEDAATARRLFGNHHIRSASPSTSKGESQRVVAIALSATSSQLSSSSGNSSNVSSLVEPDWLPLKPHPPISNSGSVTSYCGQSIEDLLQLAATPEKVSPSRSSNNDLRSTKVLVSRGLVRKQTQQSVVGGEGQVW